MESYVRYTVIGKYRPVIFLLSAVALGILAGVLITTQSASAHKFNSPFKWNTSIVPNVEDMNTGYPAQVTDAALAFNNRTDLHVDGPCGSNCGNIRYYQGNFGPMQGMAGWAEPYTSVSGNWINCAPGGILNGECNETDRRARFAYIYFNSYWGWWIDEHGYRLARHELGHVFGLNHNDVESVMNNSMQVSFLTWHDITDINSMY